MRGTGRVFWRLMCVLSIGLAGGIFVLGAPPASTVNLPPADSGYVVDDDDTPDVTARVARISFVRGEAKIRHAGGGDWENVTLNLPVVEGDEISTEAEARVEIQFGNSQHLRLAENSFLKVTTLTDDGIAVSVSLGTMSIRITEFDKDHSYFEIDAPKTTVAVQKAGAYRIDAGKAGDDEIRVAVTEGGEARIYSDTAGFTLKNNRSARVFVDGMNAGEWEASDASKFTDEFDAWTIDRDSIIVKRLADAYYNKYYDNDIYGADDLNGYGDWVYTSKYGYVWRPYPTAIGVYADWSPYRYGHWRWIPPFGWVWINDEPWGWATYHHGRWFYDDGYWYWSPYGYYRYSRSWWFPALVSITIYNNNVCWYPLPYHCHYYSWNNHHHGGHHDNQPIATGGVKPIPPGVSTTVGNTARDPKTGGIKGPPVTGVPPSGVVAVSAGTFGTTIKGGHTPPLSIANSVLSHPPGESDPPQLPAYSALTGKVGTDIIKTPPKTNLVAAQVKVGAATRQPGQALDKELRTTRVFGGRPPLTPSDTGVKPVNNSPDTRPTGAVVRQPTVKHDDPPVKHEPVYSPPQTPIREPSVKPPRQDPPVKQPHYDPPVKQPHYDPPVRHDPPTRSEPVKPPPRSDPPTKSDPKPPPTTRSDTGADKKAKNNR